MLTPPALLLMMRYLHATDTLISHHLSYKVPWDEPSLTHLLCSVLDEDTLSAYNLDYSLDALNRDLASLDGLLAVDLQIHTHQYPARFEHLVTQADLGLVIDYVDHLLPNESWTLSWLLQAKRVFRDAAGGTGYSERAALTSLDHEQEERIKKLTQTLEVPLLLHLFYCPSPEDLLFETRAKLSHLRATRLADNIFDYVLGFALHNHLSSRPSSLEAGMWVADTVGFPRNLGGIHRSVFESTMPWSWFVLMHLTEPRVLGAQGTRPAAESFLSSKFVEKQMRRDAEVRDAGIVGGNAAEIGRVLADLDLSPNAQFPFLPRRTIEISISVGRDLNEDTRQIQVD